MIIIQNTKTIFFVLIILASLLEVISDVLFKKWSINNKNISIIIGLIFYFLGSAFWAISLKYEYLSRAISVFFILNMIIIVLVGVLFFKENLSFTAKIRILLGVISIGLIKFS